MHQGLQAAQRVAAARATSPTGRSSRPSAQPARRTSMRGTPYSPGRRGNGIARARPTARAYDPTSGIIDGVVDANGDPVRFVDQGNLSVLGDDSWKWLLVGPVASRAVNRVGLNIALYVVVMVAAALLVVAAVRVLDDDPVRRRCRSRASSSSTRRPARSSSGTATSSPPPRRRRGVRQHPLRRRPGLHRRGGGRCDRRLPRPVRQVDRRRDQGPPGQQVGHGRRGALGRRGRPGPRQRDRDRRDQRHRRRTSRPATSRWPATSGSSSSSSTRRASG